MLKVEFNRIGKARQKLYLKETNINEKLKPKEVLIKVLFFPINPADLLLVEGKYASLPSKLPSPIGAECVAKVIKIGNKVKLFKINDIVIPLTRNNWVEKIKIEEINLIKIDKNIDLHQACMLKVNPASAYLMLNNYVKLKKNDTILQNAANSGVGNYIIQLAKLYNIKTVNLVRRKNVIPYLKRIGAKKVYVNNYRNSVGDSKAHVVDFILNNGKIRVWCTKWDRNNETVKEEDWADTLNVDASSLEYLEWLRTKAYK